MTKRVRPLVRGRTQLPGPGAMALRLRDNLHWCNASGTAVFLDLESGRYLSLPRAVNQAFLRLADGARQPQDERLLQMLLTRGMLVEEAGCAALQLPVTIQAPTGDYLSEPPRRANLVHLARELASELRLAWALNRQSIGTVIRAATSQTFMEGPVPSDQHQSLQSIAAGAYSCAFVTRAHDRCLIRALAVKSLCNKARIKAKLVFGVIAKPFAAHCWVQVGGAVLVGGFEQALLFTPILVIE